MIVVVAALEIVAAVADLRRAVMALEARVLPVVADSVRVAKADLRAVMAMTVAARRVVLAIVTAAPRRSASGWKCQRTCRSSFSQKTKLWTR